jgi:hypothetical protein
MHRYPCFSRLYTRPCHITSCFSSHGVPVCVCAGESWQVRRGAAHLTPSSRRVKIMSRLAIGKHLIAHLACRSESGP